MKRIAHVLPAIFIMLVTVSQVSAQCEPDTANCKDEGLPGEFCPKILPNAVLNEPYDTVITVIPPSMFEYEGSVLDIVYIEIDTVMNLPPGIEYFPNADTFFADTAYCIQITGTPTEAGDYHLSITVSPTINHDLLGIFKAPPITDDTSVVMSVEDLSGIDPFQITEFHVLPNIPNPFAEITRMGFYTPFDDRIDLKVYNILGEMVYHEKQGAPPGEHYFRFDGSALLPGTYFYRVTNSSAFYTGKFIKTR
jgi:hypothetical protein